MSESKINRLIFLILIFFLLISTSPEKQSPVDESSQTDGNSHVNISPEAERITYASEVIHGQSKALSGLKQDSCPYGNHGPLMVSPDANNRDASSVDNDETINGSYSGYDRIGYNDSILRGSMAFSLNVPRGTRIDEAYISLHAAGASGTASQVQIYVYDVASVPVFGYHSHPNGLLGHAQTWATTIPWNLTSFTWVTDSWVSTPYVTQLIQHIVDRSDWQSGNYIGFVIDGAYSGNWWRAWHHYGNLPGYAPKLTVRYTYPEWWDSNFQKRVQIKVTNNADIVLPSGYSVGFSLNTWYLTHHGELQADGNDLRIAYFNSSSGTWIELDRVNQTAFNTYKTQLWFQTQTSIPASSSDPNYYMYYSNPSAENPPDEPENVFLFFDDFDDGNSNGWATTNGSWSVQSVGSGNWVVQGDGNAYLYYPDTFGSYGDVAISARIRWEGGDRRRGVSVRFNESVTSNPASYQIHVNQDETETQLWRKQNDLQLNNTSAFPSGVNYDAGNWYRYEIAAQTVNTDDVSVRGRIYDVNMTVRTELTGLDNSSSALYVNGKIALYGEGWFDDVIVRHIVNPEPTVLLNSPLGIHLMLLTYDATDPDLYLDHKDITIDHTQVAANLTNFPLFIELYDTDLQDDAQVDGDDILFTDSLGNQLDHEIELYEPNYNATHAHLVAWVKTNVSDSSDTVISMYYGNPTVESNENPEDVWDSDYVGVWHLNEYPNGTVYDSTINNNDGTALGGMTTGDLIDAQIGKGLDFDGGNDRINVPDSSSLDITGNLTLQMWLRVNSNDWDVMLSKGRYNQGYSLYLDSSRNIWHYLKGINNGSNTDDKVSGLTWTFVVLTWDGSEIKVFINGTVVDTRTGSGTIAINNKDLDIGQGSGRGYFRGILDEVRISKNARSDGWLVTEYNNQYDPDSFFSVGNEHNYTNIPFYNHLVQDLGYVVDYHGHENMESTTSQFYLEGYDAVLISTAVDDAWMVSLGEVAIPILSWEEYNDDELYLGENSGTFFGDSIYVINNTHYITLDQSLGWVSIYSTNATMGYMEDYDPLPPGCEIVLLARTSDASRGQLMTIEKGAVDYYPPHTAPERRVFFAGRSSSSLNTAGWTLFDRALNWTLYADQQPPIIQDYGHTYYGNGTAVFYANATDALESVTSVYLNYTMDGTLQTPVSMQWNGSYWIWRTTFAYNKEIRYTILNATDSRGNVNSSLIYVWDLQHSFIVEDQVVPSIQSGDYAAMPSVDGLLQFWFNATDVGLGIDSNSGSVNITSQDYSSGIVYPMNYNGTHFIVEVGLHYWVGGIPGSTHQTFSYNFTVTDRAGLSTTGGGASEQYVPDIVAPSLGDYGVEYTPITRNATIWSTASDGVNGSGLDTPPGGVTVSYDNGTLYGPFLMQWNGTHWVYNVTGVWLGDSFTYNFTVTDYVGNFVENSGMPGSFYVQDTEAPVIHAYGHKYFGNGTVHFWANVTDNFAVDRVDLNYTVAGVPQPPVIMQDNGTLWVWSKNFAWNQTLNYTIARAQDASNNVNTTFAAVWNHGLITEDKELPQIAAAGFEALPDEDGHLRFWADVSDAYSGVNPNTVFLNLTLSSGHIDYPMSSNGTYYTIELGLSYWDGGTPEGTQQTFSYNFTVSDFAGYSTTGGGASNQYVPDIVAPSLGDYGVNYSPATRNATIWSTASDGVNGSGLDTSPPGVDVSYDNGTLYGPFPMLWNGTHWVFNVTGVWLGDSFTYNFTVTDRAGNFVDNSLTPGSFYVEDSKAPMIHAYGHEDFGNGTVRFWANVTDNFAVDLVDLNYTVAGVSQPPVIMQDNSTLWVWSQDFVWNQTLNYTIARAQDASNNANTTFAAVWDLPHSLVTVDLEPPEIAATGFEALPDEDGHLRFWANVSDIYSGVETVFLNQTLPSPSGQTDYPMSSNGTYYMVELGLPYWWNETTLIRTTFDYNVTVVDRAGLSTTGDGASGQYVPDIVAPSLGDYGVDYSPATLNATIWSTASDGVNGSGLTTPPGMINVFFRDNESVPWQGPFQCIWNGTHWVYNVTGVVPGDSFTYYFNVTDYAENLVENSGTPGSFYAQDSEPPMIHAYGHKDYGNGTIHFWANVTDDFNVYLVDLNYTVAGLPQPLSSMQNNGTLWVWSQDFAWNQTLNYTIARAQDESGNANTTFAAMWDHGLITEDKEPPQIAAVGFEALPDEDGFLRFWANVSDTYSGVDPDKIFLNLTLPSGQSDYPMSSNGTYYTVELGLPYWWNETTLTRTTFDYNATVSDRAGLFTTGGGASGEFVPDIVVPSLGDYGVKYNSLAKIATIWSTASDGTNGSGIATSPAGVNVSYFIQSLPNTTFSVRMLWNGTHWVYNVTDVTSADWFFYYFNATDRAGNFAENYNNPAYFDPQDSEAPLIYDYGHEYYGNGTVRFWANVTDLPDYNSSRVDRVDLKYNSTVNSDPQTVSMIRYNESFWEWYHDFSWNQTLSPYAVNYTIALAQDESGNANTTLANVWDTQHSLITEDWDAPKIEKSGFDALSDYDGHLRFYVDLSDYSGVDPNTVFLNLTLPSGQTDYQMSHNGTYYTVELGLPYWWSEFTRTTFDYTFTTSDIAVPKNKGTGGGASGMNVPDLVAPSISAHGVDTSPGTGSSGTGKATIWIAAADGVNGSGIDQMYVNYSIVGVGGPWTYPMAFNGTHWTYMNASLSDGEEIAYSVDVTDLENNSFISVTWTKTYFDVFPPMIVDYGYSQDGAGYVQFWAKVTDDQGSISIVRYQFWLNSLESPNVSRSMTENGTHWISDPIYFQWNTTGGYTIPYALDDHGNANMSLDDVWVKSFVTEDWDAPIPSNSNYTALTDRDGHLEFWIEVSDAYSGLDPAKIYLNLTLSGFSPQLYPMTYDAGTRYKVDLDLPYWQVMGSSRTQFDYHFEISDKAGNLAASSSQSDNVPDIVNPVATVPPAADSGFYEPGTGITIWSTAYDGVNGSGLYVPSPSNYEGVYLNYSLADPGGPYIFVPMQWNGSHWTYTISGTFSQNDKVYYYVNATDYEGNNNIGSLRWFTVEDQTPPRILSRGATDYGNGIVTFYADVTDDSPIQFVELNYTFGGVPYLQNMTYNGTYYVYTPSYIPWNTEVDYTIARAADVANNVNTTLTTDFLTLITVDLEDPVISNTGFEPLPDEDGHLRFWADIDDSYSGLDPSNIFIEIKLSSGVSVTYLMTYNGTFYTYETNIAYWEDPGTYSTRMAIIYNVTAFDNAGHSNDTGVVGPTNVPEVVPPELNGYAGVEDIGGGSARFWCTPQDGVNGSQVRDDSGASVLLYYSVNLPSYNGPYTMFDDGTRWIWEGGSFNLNQTIYYYVEVTDGAGNPTYNAATPWTHLYGDTVHPVIVIYGYDYLSDEDGHLRFWVNATDNGGIKNVTLDLFIIDTSTALAIVMPWNGSYYTTSPYLTCGHTFNYNITAYDTVLLTDKVEVMEQTVQDTVAPKILDLGPPIDYLNGTVTIWIETRDGVNGSGFPPSNDTVSLSYRKNEFGPFQQQMVWNGSGNFYTYTIENLLQGDILEYNITVQDIALNSRIIENTYTVADQTPPTIHGSGHEFVPDIDGHIRFWISVSEDIGDINKVTIAGEVAGSPPTLFSNAMTAVNDTYYIYDMYVAYSKTISYNITAWNTAGLANQTQLVSDQVEDLVAPPSQNFSTKGEDYQNGMVKFQVSITDGQYGSGINSNEVYFVYRVGGGIETMESMTWVGGTNYIYIVEDVVVGDMINYYVQATDNAGNTGEGSRGTFGVSDQTAPKINKVGYKYLNDSDGHIQFWCDATDPFGMIEQAIIKITGDHDEEGDMIWIGVNFYYDTYLMYGNTFNFTITVRDTAQNEASQFELGNTVQDTVPPRILAVDGEEFQNGTAILWAVVEDGAFGSGFPSARNTANITYQLNAGFPKTFSMVWNGTHYIHVVNDLRVGDILAFFILATDNAGNSNTGTIIAPYKFAVPDKTPPQIHAYGYNLLPEKDGRVQFWVNASDPFGTIDKVLLNITINETAATGKSASTSPNMGSMKEVEMGRLNATHWTHEEDLRFQTLFSYTIIVIDGVEHQSALRGESGQIVGDGAPPRVINADIIDPGNGKLTIWGEVEEEGTGIDSLEVIYSVDGETWEQVPMMEFNSTHYVTHIEVKAGNPIYWGITTKDLEGNEAKDAYKVWLKTPYKTQKIFPLRYILEIIAAAAVAICIAIIKFSKKRQKQILDARKRMIMEHITDIAHFLDFLAITPRGIPFYSFTGIMNQQGRLQHDSSLYSSFLLALKTFSEETLNHYGEITKENHFKFGGTEIYLYSIRELIFAYLFSAQKQDGDWKKVSHRVLERCRELTIRIERDFQNIIQAFEVSPQTDVIPYSKISKVVIEVLALDFILPHLIIDLKVHKESGLSDESSIIQTIEKVNSEEGKVSLFQVLERLKSSEISPDDIVFVFHQLREEGAIVPVTWRGENEEPPTDLEPGDTERKIEAQRTESSPEERLEEIITIPLNPEETLSLLEKLRSLVATPIEDNNRDLIN